MIFFSFFFSFLSLIDFISLSCAGVVLGSDFHSVIVNDSCPEEGEYESGLPLAQNQLVFWLNAPGENEVDFFFFFPVAFFPIFFVLFFLFFHFLNIFLFVIHNRSLEKCGSTPPMEMRFLCNTNTLIVLLW